MQVQGIDKVYVKMINKPAVDPIKLMFATAKKSVKIDEPTFTDEYLNQFSEEEMIQFLKDVIFGANHRGILEHVNYTFEIWGVSRSMTHQAVRNRIASFLEGSLRYNDPTEGIFKYIIPIALRRKDLEELRAEYERDMIAAAELYKKWYNKGKELGLPKSKCKELGRTTLPHSSCTTYTFTMNLASLVLLANKRDCVRAEEEFRTVVTPIIDSLKPELKGLIDHLGAYCKMFGYCPEGKYGCGKKPTITKLLTAYEH